MLITVSLVSALILAGTVLITTGCGVHPYDDTAVSVENADTTVSNTESAAEPAAKSSSNKPVTLSVRCGAALQPSMDAIGKVYEEKTGIRIDYAYSGAQMLLGQLAASRSGDLYMPGEAFWVDQAVKRGFVKESLTVAYFLPVLMVAKGNPKNIREVKDMAKDGIRVAMGHPEALAVGPVTKRIMERVGIWESVQKNVIMQAGCIPELANAVAMKATDVGILWDACVFQVQKHVDSVPIAPKDNEVAEVLIATLKFSEHPKEASDFAHFLTTDEVKAIFAKYFVQTERPEGVRLAPREPVISGDKGNKGKDKI